MEGHLRDIHQQMEESFSSGSNGNDQPNSARSRTNSETRQKRTRDIKKPLYKKEPPYNDENVNTLNIDPATLKKQKTEKRAKSPLAKLSEPLVWVLCWLVAKRYGLGYVLSNGCFGVYFNDGSKIILQPDRTSYIYVDKSERGVDTFHYGKADSPAPQLRKKVLLLVRIHQHISEQRNLGGLPFVDLKKGKALPDDEIIFVKGWHSNNDATLFRLSNKLVQVNYHVDESELLVCPIQRTVTYTNAQKDRCTVRLDDVKKHYPEIRKKLNYAKQLLPR